MTDELTSSPGSATPTGDQPATGNATVGATPAAATLTLEEALKKIADYEHAQKNAAEEVERHRKKLTVYEKAEAEREAAKKAADDAQLSEIERVKKQQVETEQQAQKYKQELINARVSLAAQAKGIIDPDLATLAIQKSLEYGEDGMPTNVDKALDELIKHKPYLAPKPADPPATPAQTAQPARLATPALPAFNPGRSQIASPGSIPPGQRITLADIRSKRS